MENNPIQHNIVTPKTAGYFQLGEITDKTKYVWIACHGYAQLANYFIKSFESIIDEEQLQELSNRKLRAYVKKSEKSHQDLNKKWDQGTATYKDKYKSINRERGQERAFKTLDKRSGK